MDFLQRLINVFVHCGTRGVLLACVPFPAGVYDLGPPHTLSRKLHRNASASAALGVSSGVRYWPGRACCYCWYWCWKTYCRSGWFAAFPFRAKQNYNEHKPRLRWCAAANVATQPDAPQPDDPQPDAPQPVLTRGITSKDAHVGLSTANTKRTNHYAGRDGMK